MEASGQLHAPAALTPERAPDTYSLGGWVGPRTGLDDVEKKKILPLTGLELRSLVRPTHSPGLSNVAPVIYFSGALIYSAGFNVNQNVKKKIFLNNIMFQIFS
jgi:hypothetical protein